MTDRPGLAPFKNPNTKVKQLPLVRDAQEAKMEADVTAQLKRKVMRTTKAREMGITEGGKDAQNISPGLPKLAFAIGANILECPKFNLSDEEAKAFAENLEILLPRLNTKVWAVIGIVSTIGWKLSQCKDAVQSRWKRMSLGFSKAKGAGGKVAFDEKTQSTKVK